MGPLAALPIPPDYSPGVARCGAAQRDRQCPLTGQLRFWGLDPRALMGKPHLRPLQQAVGRYVRDTSRFAPANLRITIRNTHVVDGPYPLLSLDEPHHVLLLAIRVDPHGPPLAPEHPIGHAPRRTVLAELAVVLPIPAAPVQSPVPFSARSRPADREERGSPSPRLVNAPAGCVASVRSSLQLAGFSAEAANIAVAARRPTTIRTYDSRLE